MWRYIAGNRGAFWLQDRREQIMSMTATVIEDEDALDFVGRPYWFDRHPSQAEGEDI